MFSRFGHFLFNHAQFNENEAGSDDYGRGNYIPQDSQLAGLISGTPVQVIFNSEDVAQVIPFVEEA